MKATILYLTLSTEQIAGINTNGWDSPAGKLYLATKYGKGEIDKARGLYKKVAEMELLAPRAKDPELVWSTLQNLTEAGWRNAPGVKCLTNEPRSMDVGDLILWEDGKTEMVHSFGFKPVEFDHDGFI